MKLKNLLTFVAILAAGVMSGLSATASEYYPIIEDGKVWVYSGVYIKDADAGTALHSFKFDGTVTVNGKEYRGFTMFKSEYYRLTTVVGHPVYEGAVERSGPTTFFREEEGKVYVLTKNDYIYQSSTTAENTFDGPVTSEEYGEYLRYDFTLEDGQTLYMPYENYVGDPSMGEPMDFVRVVMEEPVEIEGTERIRMSFDAVPESDLQDRHQISQPFEGYVIEGIGATEGGDLAVFSPPIPGTPNAINGPTYESALSCVYNATGDVIYGSEFKMPNMLIDENKVWNYRMDVTDYTGENVQRYRFQMAFDGTTAIEGKTYHVLKTQNVVGYRYSADQGGMVPVSEIEGKAEFYLREDNGKVYIYDRNYGSGVFESDYKPALGESNEFVLYDFNLEPGESYESYGTLGDLRNIVVNSIDKVDDGANVWNKINMTVNDNNSRSLFEVSAVEGIGFLSEYRGNNIVFFNDELSTGFYGGENPEYLPVPTYGGLYLVNVTDREGNIIVRPEMFENDAVESIDSDILGHMTLVSANGVVTAASESGSEVRLTVYGIDGTVRAEVTGTGEAAVNVSALGHGIYTVRATDGNAVRVLKVGV